MNGGTANTGRCGSIKGMFLWFHLRMEGEGVTELVWLDRTCTLAGGWWGYVGNAFSSRLFPKNSSSCGSIFFFRWSCFWWARTLLDGFVCLAEQSFQDVLLCITRINYTIYIMKRWFNQHLKTCRKLDCSPRKNTPLSQPHRKCTIIIPKKCLK